MQDIQTTNSRGVCYVLPGCSYDKRLLLVRYRSSLLLHLTEGTWPGLQKLAVSKKSNQTSISVSMLLICKDVNNSIGWLLGITVKY